MTPPAFTARLVSHDWARFSEASEVRYAVLHAPFGVERHDEWDDDDPASRHVVALSEDDRVVGYGRLIVHGSDAQIRQVAVEPAWQGAGVGRVLVEALLRLAEAEGATAIWLNARVPAIGFYERLGFEARGGYFNTGKTSVPHRRMEYRDSAANR